MRFLIRGRIHMLYRDYAFVTNAKLAIVSQYSLRHGFVLFEHRLADKESGSNFGSLIGSFGCPSS
jgi:hypothetical protein